MPNGFPSEGYFSGLKYEPTKSDIFVSTYPKCGTTWTQNIIYLLLNDGEPIPKGTTLSDVFPHLEEVGVAKIEALKTSPRLIKTHLPYGKTPINEKAKYVYVARNPKDCVVSFYHHTRGFIQHYDFEHGTFDEYFECFMNGEVDFGDYFDNLASWLDHATDDHVLVITYESLQLDFHGTVLKLAAFLDPGLPAKILNDDERILDLVKLHSGFKTMQQNAATWCSARPADQTPFIRKGKIGDWQNHFSTEQSNRMDEKIQKRIPTSTLQDVLCWTAFL